MSLSIRGTYSAIAPGLSCSFGAQGGVEPYTYSVLSGGAGGSINSSTGEYTAPVATTGVDTVKVTDSVMATAQATILVGNALELFCDIIKTELGLSDDQVYLWDQKYNIPKDSRIYVVVSMLRAKPFGNTMRPVSSGPGLNADQSVNMLATLQVDIFSRSFDAVNRKEEIVLALASVYSEQQQELNSFYVANLPTDFVNLTTLEGSAILYRFAISVNIQYLFRKIKAIDYFNDFSTVEVTTEP